MEENSLRLVLLGVGVVILVGIYLYDGWQKKRRLTLAERKSADREEKVEPFIASEEVLQPSIENEPVIQEPSLQEVDTIESVKVAPDPDPVAVIEDIPVAQQAMVVQLAVIAKPELTMAGEELKGMFTQLGLEYGDMDVFHGYHGQGDERIQSFHVTNILEPGTFPNDSMAGFESTGLMLFFQTSDAVDSIAVFNDMLTTAKALAERFNARLVDAEMNELVDEKIETIRSQLNGLSSL